MKNEFCGYPIIGILTNPDNGENHFYIDIVGTKEDAFEAMHLWNEENKLNHPRIVAMPPEEIDYDSNTELNKRHFHVELI